MSLLVEDKRKVNNGSSIERSQKIIQQNSQDMLDYFGKYESSYDVKTNASLLQVKPLGKRDRSALIVSET